MNELIAVAVDKNIKVWKGHFGIAPYFMIFNRNGEKIELRENPYAVGKSEHKHHDDPKRIVSLLNDCRVFIAKRMGDQSKRNLVEKMKITPVITSKDDPFSAVNEYLEN